MAGDKSEHLTAAQKAQLEAELAELEGPRRKEVVQAIATARGFGDLSENFEYHAAKNEQGLLESRIRRLRARLGGAIVVDEAEAAASGVVGVGSTVELEDERRREDAGADLERRRRLAGVAARQRAARPQGR